MKEGDIMDADGSKRNKVAYVRKKLAEEVNHNDTIRRNPCPH